MVDDTGVPSYFGSDDGNIYEGEGLGASLAERDAHLLEDSFQKKNNEKKGDWSDIWALYDVLNSEAARERSCSVARYSWRRSLTSTASSSGWGSPRWWAMPTRTVLRITTSTSTTTPKTGKLTWYSWDHNLTFRNDMRPLLTFDKANVSDAWPLIRYLLDDPVYKERYAKLIAENFAGVLAPDAVIAKIRAHAELLAPYAAQEMSPEEYAGAVQEIVDFVRARAGEVEEFLAREKKGARRQRGHKVRRRGSRRDGEKRARTLCPFDYTQGGATPQPAGEPPHIFQQLTVALCTRIGSVSPAQSMDLVTLTNGKLRIRFAYRLHGRWRLLPGVLNHAEQRGLCPDRDHERQERRQFCRQTGRASRAPSSSSGRGRSLRAATTTATTTTCATTMRNG